MARGRHLVEEALAEVAARLRGDVTRPVARLLRVALRVRQRSVGELVEEHADGPPIDAESVGLTADNLRRFVFGRADFGLHALVSVDLYRRSEVDEFEDTGAESASRLICEQIIPILQ